MDLKKINKIPKNISPPKGEKEYLKLLSQRTELLSDVWSEKNKYFKLNIIKDLIIFILLGALIFLSFQKDIRVILTQIDSGTGAVLNTDKITKSNTNVGEKEIKYFLTRFVLDVRSVPIDKNYYSNMLKEKNLFLTNNSQGKLNEIVRVDGIELLNERKTSIAKITSVNVVTNTKNTYQVRWNETVFESNGEKSETRKYIGIFTVDFIRFEKEEEILKNPLGIIIKDFSISKESS